MFAITHRHIVAILSGVAVAAIAGMRLVGAAEDKKDEPLSPEPTIVVDNRPESGVPPEALAQIHVKLSAAET